MIGQRKKRGGLRLSSPVPKVQWDSNPLPLRLLGCGKPLPFIEDKSKIIVLILNENARRYGSNDGPQTKF